MDQVEHVLGVHNELGECPIWNPKEQALYWINIEGNASAHRFDPGTGKHEVCNLNFPITAFGLRASGGWITAARNGLAFWDWQSQNYEFITDPEADTPDVRFNDGVVDRQITAQDRDPDVAQIADEVHNRHHQPGEEL